MNVFPIRDFQLIVQFDEGITKIYDVKPLFHRIVVFKEFESNPDLFKQATVSPGGYGVIWNDEIDLSVNELWGNGETIEFPFEELMFADDAAKL